MVRKGPFEELNTNISGRGIAGGGNRMCKEPEAGTNWCNSRNRKDTEREIQMKSKRKTEAGHMGLGSPRESGCFLSVIKGHRSFNSML